MPRNRQRWSPFRSHLGDPSQGLFCILVKGRVIPSIIGKQPDPPQSLASYLTPPTPPSPCDSGKRHPSLIWEDPREGAVPASVPAGCAPCRSGQLGHPGQGVGFCVPFPTGADMLGSTGNWCSGFTATGSCLTMFSWDPGKYLKSLISPVQSEASRKPHPLPSSLASQV